MDPSESHKKQGHILAGRYEIISEIGRGGFGMVYRARQLNIDREVAIKILPPQFMSIADVVERFKREAQLTSQLTHPNTITIHDYGKADNLLYIVMEFLEGEDLADVLKRDTTLPEHRIIHISRQILKSLAEAHQKGIVHRDLKPENIFLCSSMTDEEEFVKVLDFGIAKLAQPDGSMSVEGKRLTVTGSTVGTPVYMSPEQAAGEEVDHLTDLYALGVIMYEMVCGSPPFMDKNPVKIMRSHLFQEVPPFPEDIQPVNPHLERVILNALQKDKELRYQSAKEFLNALDNSRPVITALPSSLLSSLPPATRQLTPPQLEDDLPTIELVEESSPEDDLLGGLGQPAHASVDAIPFGKLTNLTPPPAKSSPYHTPLPSDLEDVPPEGLASGGLSTSSAILSIIEHTPQLHESEDEVIVLTKTKKPSNSFKRSDLDVGQEGQAPVSLGKIEVSPAPSDTTTAPTEQPEQKENWSWDPQSTPDARNIDSGAYPQLKKKQEDSRTARRTPVIALIIFLLILVSSVALYLFAR